LWRICVKGRQGWGRDVAPLCLDSAFGGRPGAEEQVLALLVSHDSPRDVLGGGGHGQQNKPSPWRPWPCRMVSAARRRQACRGRRRRVCVCCVVWLGESTREDESPAAGQSKVPLGPAIARATHWCIPLEIRKRMSSVWYACRVSLICCLWSSKRVKKKSWSPLGKHQRLASPAEVDVVAFPPCADSVLGRNTRTRCLRLI
jgi:hypothetical protein